MALKKCVEISKSEHDLHRSYEPIFFYDNYQRMSRK